MAADVGSAPPKHDPDAEDVKGDDYDPQYDADRSGDHDKAETKKRKDMAESAAKDSEIPPGMTVEEMTGKLVPISN